MNSPKTRLYWLLQILGWGAYCLVNYLSLPLFDLKIPFSGIAMAISAGVGVLTTHWFRAFIRKRRWLELSFARQVPRVLVAAGVMMLVFNVVQLLAGGVLGVIAAMSGVAMAGQGYVAGTSFGGYAFLSMLNIYAMMLIWSLIYFVYHTFERLQTAQMNELSYQARLREAELSTLRAQLNPHFLFNALNSIRALTLEQPEAARTAITRLSELLRASLNASHRPLIPLEEELQMVRDYLAIEQVRFEERLQVRIAVEEAANPVLIPPLLVQTLVENAIKHGISQLKEGGKVELMARLSLAARLEVEVRNSGVFAPEPGDTQGLGLENVRKRIAALYGADARFTIVQQTPQLVSATLILPVSLP